MNFIPLAVSIKNSVKLFCNGNIINRHLAFYACRVYVPKLTLQKPAFCKYFSKLSHQSEEKGNPKHSSCNGYIEASDNETLDVVSKNVLIYPDFISAEEEKFILDEIEPYMKRLRYEVDHWDDAIHGYKETERKQWNTRNSAILERVKQLAFPKNIPQLAYVHVLELSKEGYIKPHIDAVRFCGNTIAGMNLLSAAVMKFVHETDKNKSAKVLLKQRSLYIMKDAVRYHYTHEILPEKESYFRGEVVPRDRRISVICRNEPDPSLNS
ncbi:alpha-ketoglutarate-dependent dioxygenase alkB homolog 7, mitochondrial-like [Gigantopelta aegis]|uniref:alpha-ketoglutarate-dependent dioxygenase alkB homolog 7, mitochondrial-like n=1 Tax=Gigantopelta aegis TaxID=1735272 RepID=UPI001B88C7DD|nr:alpha-ketoglutarate-dependent dioxygenase alkB homolog 7, mitochondrial-like [Gigantopelta aegis]